MSNDYLHVKDAWRGRDCPGLYLICEIANATNFSISWTATLMMDLESQGFSTMRQIDLFIYPHITFSEVRYCRELLIESFQGSEC